MLKNNLQKTWKLAGIFLMLGGIVFFLTEFITAAAWSHPAYSYTYNFISNLGVRGPSHLFGQYMISPLAWVMNLGFISFGILLGLGVLLLPHPGHTHRWILSVLALVLGFGGILVGVFHGSGEALVDGTGMYHSFGAFMAFISGNVISILLGRSDMPVSHKTKMLLVVLGIIGVIATVGYTAALILAPDNHPIIIIGLIERGAVYPFLIGLMAAGYSLLKVEPVVRN